MLLSGMLVTGVVTRLRYNFMPVQVDTEAQDRVNCYENADFTTYKEAFVLTASRSHGLSSSQPVVLTACLLCSLLLVLTSA